MISTIPIFPLNTVLFPDGILPLRIFEPRYTDMVSECMKEDKGFGVCLIRNGNEMGTPATVFTVGTVARIIDWTRHDDGLLGISACGTQRFKIIESRIRKNQLMEADIELLDDQDDVMISPEYQLYSDILRKIVERFEIDYISQNEQYDNLYWVGSRLAELLPIDVQQRQAVLEMNSPAERIRELGNVVDKLDFDQ